MQGGDFFYDSTGISKDEQQQKSAEKRGKKGNFQLSKILPSPSKKRSEYTSQIPSESLENDRLPDGSGDKQQAKNDHGDHTEVSEAAQETDDETSDGDWYVFGQCPK